MTAISPIGQPLLDKIAELQASNFHVSGLAYHPSNGTATLTFHPAHPSPNAPSASQGDFLSDLGSTDVPKKKTPPRPIPD